MQKLPIDTEYLLRTLAELLAIPSPTGCTDQVVHYTGEALQALDKGAAAAPRLCKCGRAPCDLQTDYCAICTEERAPVAPRAPKSKQQRDARKLCLETAVARAEGALRTLKRKREDVDRSIEHATRVPS